MLVGALQVEVGRKRQILALPQHGKVGHAGVEPHVQRVGHLFIIGGIAAEQLGRIQFIPGVDAPLFDAPRDGLDEAGAVRVQFAAFPVHEQRDRHTPGPLARDAPVRPVLHHAGDARLPPVRYPFDLPDLAQCRRAQVILLHADEPLRRGAEDDRRLVPPAVRITVPELLFVQQRRRGSSEPR